MRNRRHNIMKSCKIHFIHYDRKGINCKGNFTTCRREIHAWTKIEPMRWRIYFSSFFYHPNKRSWLSHLSYCKEGLHNSSICNEWPQSISQQRILIFEKLSLRLEIHALEKSASKRFSRFFKITVHSTALVGRAVCWECTTRNANDTTSFVLIFNRFESRESQQP